MYVPHKKLIERHSLSWIEVILESQDILDQLEEHPIYFRPTFMYNKRLPIDPKFVDHIGTVPNKPKSCLK